MNEEIFSVRKNPARAKSLIDMARERLTDINKEQKPYRIVEDYYEIIKELITALMYLDGFKTLSHKMLVLYLKENYNQFSRHEIIIIDELRKMRNNIVYYGQKIGKEFLINNEKMIESIINKLFRIAESNVRKSE